MDRAFETEHVANTTSDLIWCALDHCPTFAQDVFVDATLEDCESIVFTLLGYVNRKRPVPQWNFSEHYYRQALERNTSSNWCAAQSYVTQLFLSKGDWSSAQAELEILCQECITDVGLSTSRSGSTDGAAASLPPTILRVRQEYERLVDTSDMDVVWPSACGVDGPTTIAANSATYKPEAGWLVLCFVLLLTFGLGRR